MIPFVLVSAALATHDSARGQVKEEMRSVQAVWFRVKGKGVKRLRGLRVKGLRD